MVSNVSTIKYSDLSSGNLDDWMEVISGDDRFSSPYFHPYYFESCARVGRKVYVSVINNDDGTSFFPFEVISKNNAGPVGAVMSDFQSVISRNLNKINLYDLVKNSGLKTFSYDHLIFDCNDSLSSNPSISPTIDIQNGYEEYRNRKLQGKSKLFKKIDRFKKNIKNNLGPLRYVHDCADLSNLPVLIELKSKQYIRSGLIDLFKLDWPLLLLRDIGNRKEVEFKGVLSCLYAGEDLIFLHFGMQTTKRFHYWFPAYPEMYSSYSPGIVGLDYLIQAASSENIGKIDLGKGDNMYKARFANSETAVFEGRIITSHLTQCVSSLTKLVQETIAKSPFLCSVSRPLRKITHNYFLSRKYR